MCQPARAQNAARRNKREQLKYSPPVVMRMVAMGSMGRSSLPPESSVSKAYTTPSSATLIRRTPSSSIVGVTAAWYGLVGMANAAPGFLPCGGEAESGSVSWGKGAKTKRRHKRFPRPTLSPEASVQRLMMVSSGCGRARDMT
jgi:hypothetical protein